MDVVVLIVPFLLPAGSLRDVLTVGTVFAARLEVSSRAAGAPARLARDCAGGLLIANLGAMARAGTRAGNRAGARAGTRAGRPLPAVVVARAGTRAAGVVSPLGSAALAAALAIGVASTS